MLWAGSAEILPSAFGQVQSRIGAALSLLLDHFLRCQSFGSARLVSTACDLLDIEEVHYRAHSEEAFGPVLQILKSEGEAGASAALDLVQTNAKSILGAARKPTIKSDQRPRYESALANLARRLVHKGSYVPGLTVHQAKGEQWERVAVLCTAEDLQDVAAGLDFGTHEHRRLYVALTRARHHVGFIELPSA